MPSPRPIVLLLVLFALCMAPVFGQLLGKKPSSAQATGGMATVDYEYQGTRYQFRIYGGEIHQVLQSGKVLLMIYNGTVMAYPGADLSAAAGGQAAYNAYQTAHQPAAAAGGEAKSGVTVAGVVQMLNAGISEDIIIEKIHKSGQTFDLSADDMIALKKAKASDTLIKAMMDATPAPAAAADSSATSATAGNTAPDAGAPADASSGNPPPAVQVAPRKKKGFFASIGEGVSDTIHGRTVIDKLGLRNTLPQWDPNRPLSDQFPHIAVTVVYAPMGWTDSYRTDKTTQGRDVLPSCFKLKMRIWSDAQHSKGMGPFDWCAAHDAMMPELGPEYLFSMNKAMADFRGNYLTGVNRTDGPAPPDTLLPNDRRTLDMEAATNPMARSVDLNHDEESRFALMFANVRKDLGETLGTDGDYRVWVVTIEKAAGANLR